VGWCMTIILGPRWAGTKGGAFGLRGRPHVRILMPTFVEGAMEGVSDERVMPVGLVIIIVGLAF